MNLAQSAQSLGVLVKTLPEELRLHVSSYLPCRDLAAMGHGNASTHRVSFPCEQLSRIYENAITTTIRRLGGQMFLEVIENVKKLCRLNNIAPESILVTSLSLPLAAAATNSAEHLPNNVCQQTRWISIICTPEIARLIRELLFEW